MVAPIPDDLDTRMWDVIRWAEEQGQYLPTSAHAMVLNYLAANAFYEEPNPEDAPRGQVLFAASKYPAIRSACAIKSDTTLRKILSDLQEMAYIHRARRRGEGHQPLRIRVLWDEGMDSYRARLRAGEEDLHPRFMLHPEARKARAEVIQLRPVATLNS